MEEDVSFSESSRSCVHGAARLKAELVLRGAMC